MKFEAIYKRSVNLLINPKLEWEVIKTENKSGKEVFTGFALPIILLVSFCTIIANAIYTTRLEYSPLYIISSGVALFMIGYFGLIVGIRMINEITPSFNSKKDLTLISNLVIYSLSAYGILFALAILLPKPYYEVRFFGFYSIYLFWLGSGTLCDTPTDNKVGFVFVSNLILFGIFSIFFMIFDGIVKGWFGFHLFYK